MRIDSEHASNSEDFALLDGRACAEASQRQSRGALSRNGGVHGAVGAGASRQSLDRLRHVDLVKAQHAGAHQSILELLADGVGGIEQALHAFNQASVGRRIDGRITRRHDSRVFVELLLSLQQHQRGAGNGAGRADAVTDALKCVCHVSVNRRGQLTDTRFQHTFREVVQLHGEFGRGEVDADMLLGSHGQRGVLLIIVLHLQGGAVSHQSAIRQTDTQRGTNLRAFNGERIVVLAVNVTGEHQVVLKDFESFPGDHIDSKQAIRHDMSFRS